ncbi:response regulator receiver protein [Microbulbifer sp. JMSA004]|uniref:response regulator receiver protein n=1 Tax=unclassified Microbulbifer TaxID=2619833 RepID=UPI0024ACE049|nr:response regulator receiver protein [Microbulbifer sp. VAAF005]WHI47977.1 response regulator receiver protein [Microbulbifer sp. VAAF005]
MIKFKAFILLIVLSFPAVADEIWFTSTITRVYPHGDGRFVITFADDSTSCTNGVDPKYHWVKVGEKGVTEEGLNLMFGAALAGAAAGKQVRVNFDDSTSYCYISRLFVIY